MTASRPFNSVLVLVFLALSLVGLWKMRIEPVIEGVPVGFDDMILDKQQLPSGQPIRTYYTGVAPVDQLLQTLVGAFITGTAGLEPHLRLQQIYFLGEFVSVLAVWNTEAYRQRNEWRATSFTGIFAVLYQTIGGAFVLPVYYMTSLLLSRKDTYLTSGREVSKADAAAIVPALVLGYAVPTVLMYYPWNEIDITQIFTAIWQPTPFFPNILVWIFSLAQQKIFAPTGQQAAKVSQVKRTYVFSGVICVAIHLAVVYVSLTSADSRVSLASVFLPSRQTWKEDMAHGLHWIFLWDLWLCFGSSLLWVTISIIDVYRVRGELTLAKIAKVISVITISSVAIGPGSVMSFAWYWREGQLASLERKSEMRTKKMR